MDTNIPHLALQVPCARKNDNLGWTVGCAYKGPSDAFGVRSNDFSAFERLDNFVPHFCDKAEHMGVLHIVSLWVGQQAQRKGVRNYHVVYYGWQRLGRTLDLEEAFSYTRIPIANLVCRSRESAWQEGDVLLRGDESLLIVGNAERREMAKDHLLVLGWHKFSENFVFYTNDSLVLPYDPSRKDLKQSPVKVDQILFLDDEGTSDLTAGQATVRLFGSIAGMLDPGPRIEMLTRMCTRAKILATLAGDKIDVAESLRTKLEANV